VSATSPAVLVGLKRRAKETGRTVSETIHYYAMERFLYRLGTSRHRDVFVLKGAMMLRAWDAASARSTRDIDFLAFASNDLESIRQILTEICGMDAGEDAVVFDSESIRMELIKEFDDYQGARARFQAKLETARIPMQLDIGFGDAVHPEAVWAEFPTLLASPAPRIRMYSRASVVAEKLHAMAKLGAINSRMKDYHDIWFLSSRSSFKSHELAGAIAATFEARKTAIPADLEGLSDEFVRLHRDMWAGFLRREPTLAKIGLVEVVDRLRAFLLPCVVHRAAEDSSPEIWEPSRGEWVSSTE
jgi:predicted nucleotidyltransferase component of viral defense system